MYADDTGIHDFGVPVAELETTINNDLVNFCKWLKINKLCINVGKCKSMIITSHCNFSKLPKKPEILVLGKELEQLPNIAYFGGTSDHHLKWNKHVSSLTKKLKCI